MKDTIKKFLSNKLNLACVIMECIAIILLIIGACGVPVCVILFLIVEGVTLIIWGIRTIKQNGQIVFNKQYYDELPYSTEQKMAMEKMDNRAMKNNKLNGWIYIVMGVVLIFASIPFIV